MKKYVLLGVLAILLVAIPMAVAATTTSTATAEVCDAAESYQFPSDDDYSFGSMVIGDTVTQEANMVITTCDHTQWHITMQDGYCDIAGHPGHMYTADYYPPTNHWLTNALQIQNWNTGSDHRTDLTSSCSPGVGGQGPVTVWTGPGSGEGYTKSMDITQSVVATDFGGHYTLPIVFAFMPDN